MGGDVAVGCRVWRQTCRGREAGVAEPCIGAAVHKLQQCEGWLVGNSVAEVAEGSWVAGGTSGVRSFSHAYVPLHCSRTKRPGTRCFAPRMTAGDGVWV